MDISIINNRIVESIRSGDIPVFRQAVIKWLNKTATDEEIAQLLEGRDLTEKELQRV